MQKHKIMIVEDNPDVRELIRTALANQEYVISLAENGKEAIEQLPLFSPDVMVLDIVMPVMNGWEVLEFLLNDPLYAKTKVLVASSLWLTPSMFTSRGLPSDTPVLSKPFRIADLRSTVRNLLEEKPISNVMAA